jgi:hypothetical protein
MLAKITADDVTRVTNVEFFGVVGGPALMVHFKGSAWLNNEGLVEKLDWERKFGPYDHIRIDDGMVIGDGLLVAEAEKEGEEMVLYIPCGGPAWWQGFELSVSDGTEEAKAVDGNDPVKEEDLHYYRDILTKRLSDGRTEK